MAKLTFGVAAAISKKSSTGDGLWSNSVLLDKKLLTMCVRPLRFDRKGDITTLLSFWDFYLFELYILLLLSALSFICYLFGNGYKPRRTSHFVIHCFRNCQEAEARDTKKIMTLWRFFHFQIFETFRNLQLDFSINLNKCFWIMISSFGVTLLFR